MPRNFRSSVRVGRNNVTQPSSYFYQLDGHILQHVDRCKYLGVNIASDLNWSYHIDKITKKASSTLGFIRRNLRFCPGSSKRMAYFSLVRSGLEYGASVWDPFHATDITTLERVQKRAVRFIANDYKSRTPGCVDQMMSTWSIPSLQNRRREIRLCQFYKITNDLCPAINKSDFLSPIQGRRRIKPKFNPDFITSNIISSSARNNSNCFKVPRANNDIYKNSFFVRTVIDWNNLNNTTVTAPSVEAFKERLRCY